MFHEAGSRVVLVNNVDLVRQIPLPNQADPTVRHRQMLVTINPLLNSPTTTLNLLIFDYLLEFLFIGF